VPFSIDTRLKERIAHELLSGYAEAQRAGAFERCAQVEDILTRWLRTVGAGYQQPVPLSTLDLALRGVAGLEIQRAALTILSLIAQNLGECHERVFETLVPTLRGLTGLNDTGLNGIGPRRATTAIAPATDCLLADLALTALSYLGPKGPAGAYLAEVREHFASNPDQWQLLARYSLECRVLLSFAEVPAEGERFTRFETAIERWIALRDRLAADGTTKAVAIAEPDVTVCREILVELLECAEETCYPEAMHLLAMLRASVKQPDRPWRAVWKDYLVQHLHASSAVTYQVAVLLWTVLFPHQVEQEAIADRVMRDYRGGGSARPFAQHLIALLVNDLTEPTELRNLDELHYLIYLRDLSYRRYLRDMSNMPNVRNLRYLSYLRRLRSMEQLRFLSLMRHQRFLRYKLLTIEVAELAMHRLATASAEERTDLLAIVLGRILQIRERRKTRTARTEELNAVARIARETLGPSGQHPDSEALHAIREMLRRHSQEQGQEQPRFDPLTSAGALRLGTQEVERHLAALAREVHQKGLAFDLLLLGEPALLLSDVGDRESIAVIETYFFPDYVAIPEAAAAVARAHGLPNGWLTSALAGFTYIFKKEPPRQLWRTFPGLRVFTPTLEYVLVMKVMASRPRDDADIAELMAKADITQAEQLIALMREYIPDEHLTPDLLHEIEDRFVR
jgi:hypothetical protein